MPNTEESIQQTGGVPDVEMEVEIFGMIQQPTDKTLKVAEMPADAKATGDALDTLRDDLTDAMADIGVITEWTGENIPVSSDGGAKTIAQVAAELQAKTGASIPMNAEAGAQTIEAAIRAVYTNLYPVGSLYVTAANAMPAALTEIGTWLEVLLPMTWGDMHYGQRSYVARESAAAGNLHFWVRVS